MAKTFHLIITSVGTALFDGPARSVTVPGAEGELTILADHEPFITSLKSGIVTVHAPHEKKETFDIQSGVVECVGDHATILL